VVAARTRIETETDNKAGVHVKSDESRKYQPWANVPSIKVNQTAETLRVHRSSESKIEN